MTKKEVRGIERKAWSTVATVGSSSELGKNTSITLKD